MKATHNISVNYMNSNTIEDKNECVSINRNMAPLKNQNMRRRKRMKFRSMKVCNPHSNDNNWIVSSIELQDTKAASSSSTNNHSHHSNCHSPSHSQPVPPPSTAAAHRLCTSESIALENGQNYSDANQITPPQSSCRSPPLPESKPFVNQHEHSSNSFHFHLPDSFSSIPPPSTADDGQLQAASGHGSNSRTIDDVAEVLENEWSSDANQTISPQARTFLYRSALKGEWIRVKPLIEKWPHCVRSAITRNQETVLHVAAGAKQTEFVKELVQRMTSIDIALQNKYGNTALCFAATSGIVRIAELIVENNNDLPLIRGFSNLTPLFMAVSYKHKLMASYLFSVTDLNQLTPEDQIELLIATIHSDFFDISLQVLRMNPNLATMKCAKNNYETALHVMARKPLAIGSASKRLNIWKKCINFCIRGAYNKDLMNTFAREVVKLLWDFIVEELSEKEMLDFIKHPTRLLHDAARVENVEFLILLINLYPDIVWEEDDEGKIIFDVAIENRLENVFNLIDEIGGLNEFAMKHRLTNRKYNMLHTVANLATPNNLSRVTGAAFQMQRELLWFKEVERIVLPSQLTTKSNDSDHPQASKLTPRELFTENHKDLRKAGEEWMKSTANSCMLVAALIATVVFAAAFTVPCGCDNNTSRPVFQHNPWFTVFVISDAAALVSSSTSILMFMSILTSRYAEDDFLYSLPSRLLIGLTSLFVSIVFMVVTFSAAFFMLYQNASIRVPVAVAVLTILPVCCFCRLQFTLWIDTFHNTYLSRFLFRSRGRLFSSYSYVPYHVNAYYYYSVD